MFVCSMVTLLQACMATLLQVCMRRLESECPSAVCFPHSGVCTGSSTRHIVTFDGQNFKLTGNCSYVLFQNKEQDLEVVLHNGACSPRAMQACMKSIEVKHAGLSVELHSDMEVRRVCCGIHGRAERSFRETAWFELLLPPGSQLSPD